MDLDVPEHVLGLRDQLLRFLTSEIYPVEPLLERGFGDPVGRRELSRLQEKAKAQGLWALGHPQSIGGAGLPMDDYLYVNEVIGMSEYAMFVFGTHTLHDALMLDKYGDDQWRSRYLRPLVNGEIATPAFAMTERDVAGSDPTGIETSAELVGDCWVINGRKWFTTHAHSARFTVVMAKTETDATPHTSFSLLIVPSDAPGYQVLRTIPTMGDVDGDHCEVLYDNVRIPAENLLGTRGSGFAIAQDRLGAGRVFHCMRFLGQAQRAFDLMCVRAVSRTLKGVPLGDKQLVQKMVFDTASEIRAARHLTLEAARMVAQGRSARVEIGIAKVLGASAMHNAIDRAIQVYGSIGVSGDLPLARMYRNARYARLYDGADEVHISNVASSLLRPYRERQEAAR
jgi:alkylation response protein AidB-like acyl-CoA dehydrogenase